MQGTGSRGCQVGAQAQGAEAQGVRHQRVRCQGAEAWEWQMGGQVASREGATGTVGSETSASGYRHCRGASVGSASTGGTKWWGRKRGEGKGSGHLRTPPLSFGYCLSFCSGGGVGNDASKLDCICGKL